MASSDDEDAYLYGSDDEQPSTKKQKLEPKPETKPEEPKQETPIEDASDDEEEEDSSDDDIEFVIGDSAPKISTATATNTASAALNDTVSSTAEAKEGSTDKDKNGIQVSKDQGASSIDINKVAELDGKPLTQVDLEELKDKPWRIPGADISDYFNYGFDEFTWTAYCHKQDKLRGEFNPQKVMANMMGGSKGGMPMFPFPMPPNMGNMPMPPNMPNMPMPPNMQNMPMPPNMGNMPMPPNMPGQGSAPKQPSKLQNKNQGQRSGRGYRNSPQPPKR